MPPVVYQRTNSHAAQFAATASLKEARRIAAQNSSAGAVCMSFDDGYAVHKTLADLATARGQRLTFGITSDFLDTGGKLTSAQVIAMHAAGHEIANHSKTHATLTSLTAAQRVTEYETPQTVLEALVGAGQVTSYVIPYGTRSDDVERELHLRNNRILSVGHGYYVQDRRDADTFTTGRLIWSAASHAYALNLIRKAAVRPIIVNLCAHNIDTGAEITTAQFTEALDLAASLNVPLLTHKEAYPAAAALVDGGFEDPLLGAWTKAQSGVGQVMESVEDTPVTGLSGTRSLHLTTNGDTAFVYAYQQVPVIPGRTYGLTGRFRRSVTSGAGSTQVRIAGRDFAGTNLGQTDGTLTDTSWGRFSITHLMPASARVAEIQCKITSLTAEAWFDHLHFGLTNAGSFG